MVAGAILRAQPAACRYLADVREAPRDLIAAARLGAFT
jgi:hypothetical protein